MDDLKTFAALLATVLGITVSAALLIVLLMTISSSLFLVGWVLLAVVGAAALGASVRFLLLPILHGGVSLVEQVIDLCLKVSYHRTQKMLAERSIPLDDNGNALLYGVDPGLLVQVRGQFKQPVPSSLRYDHKGLPAPTVDAEPASKRETIPAVVPYAHIAEQVPSDLSLLGIYPDNGDLEIVSPDRYKTAWFVGGSNMGKTNTVYGKVADAVRWGARLIICDPHAHKDDSLTNKLHDFHHALLIPIAQTDEQIMQAILFFLEEFRARRDVGKSCAQKWLIVCDDVNGLAKHVVRLNEPVARMLKEVYGIDIKGDRVRMSVFLRLLAETCGYESRGFDLFGFFISQQVAGLAWLRNCMMTVFVHGLLMQSEAMLAANNDRKLAEQVMGFKKGRTLVYGYEFNPVILQQPLYEKPKEEHPSTFTKELEQVSQSLLDPSLVPSVEPSAIPSAEPSESSSMDGTGLVGNKPMDRTFSGDVLKLKKVLSLLQQQKAQQEIVCEVWNVKPNTRACREATEEYRKMLAFLAKESEM